MAILKNGLQSGYSIDKNNQPIIKTPDPPDRHQGALPAELRSPNLFEIARRLKPFSTSSLLK